MKKFVKRNYKSYTVWRQMLQRCRDKNCESYKDYGGRGIKVCERWQEFRNFLEDMGESPDGFTLDRINNDGNYEKSNCRWATSMMQARNYRRNVMITYQGRTQCMMDWSIELGVNFKTISNRIKMGWSPIAALTHPRSIHHSRHGRDFDRSKAWSEVCPTPNLL